MYYVYQWTDPRKNEPIYIGKGQGNRYKSMNSRNKILRDKIKKITSDGFTVVKEKLYDGMTEESALAKEVELIAEIGRYDLGLGPLLNLTNGGDGLTADDATYYANKRVKDGTHNFQGSNNENTRHIIDGTHNFLGPESNQARKDAGNHNLVNDNPMTKRKGWKYMYNPANRTSSRVHPDMIQENLEKGWLMGNYNNPQKKDNWC